MARPPLTDGPRAHPVHSALERFVRTMDDAFPIPGTPFRFGLDAILGLVPGVGDVAGGLASAALLVVAAREGVPFLVLLRMAFHVGLDALVGSVPVLGTLFDIGYKANRRNLRLLDRHRAQDLTPRDGVLGLAVVAVVLAVLIVPLVLAAALAVWLLSVLF